MKKVENNSKTKTKEKKTNVKPTKEVVVPEVKEVKTETTSNKKCSYDLFFILGGILLLAFVLTWILPYGYFQEGSFFEYGMNRLGLMDIPTVLYYSLYFCLTTVIYLFVVGGFYGVCSKADGYKALVKSCAKLVKKNEIAAAIVIIVVLAGLSSVLTSTTVLIVFLPFIISVLLNAKFDKVTAFGISFGSLFLGQIGATYGSDGLVFFNNYLSLDHTTGLTYRVIIAGIALVLFAVYNALRVRKMVKGKVNANEVKEDTFAVEEVNGKVKTWPMIVVFAVLAVFVIIGYFDWVGIFNVNCFTQFHEWLTEITIGEEYALFSYILGTSAVALGTVEITALILVLLIASPIVALMNNIKVKEFMGAFGEGFAKMLKPVSLYLLAYTVFIVSYMTPFMSSVSDWIFGLTKNFNPFTSTVAALLTSVFHADLGYTGYLVGSLLTTTYAANLDILHTIYVVTYGLVQLFVPTSGLLLLGLSYSKINYKSWVKYIWMFFVAVLVVLLIVATIGTYAL